MLARFHAATIERIKDAADIALEVEQHVRLRRAGKSLVGCCPFHAEKTPSFHVSPERDRAHCFGCGWDGDVFAFVMAVEKVSFPDAVRLLAKRYGIALSHTKAAPDAVERRARANAAAWHAYDEIARLRRRYTDGLHRCDRLCTAIGLRLRAERNPSLSDSLARLAPVQTFFLAAFQFFGNANPAKLARFAFAGAAERRAMILDGASDEPAIAA